jgi:hypothetical protein
MPAVDMTMAEGEASVGDLEVDGDDEEEVNRMDQALKNQGRPIPWKLMMRILIRSTTRIVGVCCGSSLRYLFRLNGLSVFVLFDPSYIRCRLIICCV